MELINNIKVQLSTYDKYGQRIGMVSDNDVVNNYRNLIYVIKGFQKCCLINDYKLLDLKNNTDEVSLALMELSKKHTLKAVYGSTLKLKNGETYDKHVIIVYKKDSFYKNANMLSHIYHDKISKFEMLHHSLTTQSHGPKHRDHVIGTLLGYNQQQIRGFFKKNGVEHKLYEFAKNISNDWVKDNTNKLSKNVPLELTDVITGLDSCVSENDIDLEDRKSVYWRRK
jgi:hypothetical protein